LGKTAQTFHGVSWRFMAFHGVSWRFVELAETKQFCSFVSVSFKFNFNRADSIKGAATPLQGGAGLPRQNRLSIFQPFLRPIGVDAAIFSSAPSSRRVSDAAHAVATQYAATGRRSHARPCTPSYVPFEARVDAFCTLTTGRVRTMA